MHQRLSLSQLEAFLKLGEAGSFHQAALELGVSQPAFSRTIQQIETRLGVRLFDRDTRHVRLTLAGERLRPVATRLLRDYDDSFRDFEAYVGGRSGRIRVATLPSVAATLLPGAIRRFSAAFPGVTIDLWEDVGTPVHRAVAEAEADFGIAPPPASSLGLNFKTIYQDPVVLACRIDDPLVAETRHDWQVFRDHPFIAMSPDTGLRNLIDQAFEAAGVTVEPLFNCKQPATACALIAASLGIGALTRMTIAQVNHPDLTWRSLGRPEASRPIGLVTSAARTSMMPARAFMREVEAEARTLALR
ncbi:LysR family transcriptional regulator [Sphingomonas lycopersici]|uniref:LysR family transcriptional regulator n=1 Tax=Sphingomonas lycopersici TaxID=2951807 RepID=A0AA42CS10_9SPHN|nr:LysR family transcriptional regulator [Sphingomonas lycopersici]MCW6530793.1 LysR family transcriptional regulator [Sphingomonas lycopersici]MCW6536732.1 LysR family transcriptional regulator [Sphingomonas lycopersici]